ncbi:MAG: repressor LexA [Candidatus Marinimicrobia bacterium]|nr:repressor LexA [Candidatus Neomarinimicrobiota bacterium]
MKHLSPKQKRFIDFVRNFIRDHQYPPSFEEIKVELGFSSLGTVNWYVQELVRRGHLRREKGFNGKRALMPVEETSRLPLLGVITAGYPLEAIENIETVEVPPTYIHPDNFVLKVKGDSMLEDNIQDGDFVIVRKVQEAEPGQAVVAFINGEATLKRYYPKSDRIELHPQNPEYDIITVVPEDDFRIGGVVLSVFRDYY